MNTYRMITPANRAGRMVEVSGRSYQLTPGQMLDVPQHHLEAVGSAGAELIGPVGTSADRPAQPYRGGVYIDTDLNKMIVFDGHAWRDPVTGAAV